MMKAKKTSRKKQIQEVAQNMFKDKGYAATSMRDIAKEVKIEAASLYNHFSSKEEILKKICFDIAGEFMTRINKVKKLNLPSEEKLSKAIYEHVHVITTNIDAAAVFLREWRFLKEDNLKKFKQMRNNYAEEFKLIIRVGIGRDEFEKIDVNIYALTLFSSFDWLYEYYDPDGRDTPEEIAEKVSHFLLKGIVSKRKKETQS